MKLYLSSYRIPDEQSLFKLFNKPPQDLSGVIIANAKDRKPPEERAQKLSDLQNYLANIGLNNTISVDLMEFGSDTQQLNNYLAGFDYVYVAGGNTFELCRAMKNSGYHQIVRKLLDSGQVYIGESAGAIVAGPSLRGIQSIDEASDKDLEDLDGLALIDIMLVPHNDSSDERFANRYPSIAKQNPGLDVRPLNDNQAMVFDGDKYQLVSG